MADNVIETGRSRIEDILLKASNGEALSRIEEILLNLYNDLVHLGSDGKIPAELIPPQVFERMITVTDDTARFALTTDDVQNGDWVYVNSTQIMYFVSDEDHLDAEAGYTPVAAGIAAKAVADKYGNRIDTTYQTKFDNNNKLSADLVDDTNTIKKFATAAQLDQINTNKNNISLITPVIGNKIQYNLTGANWQKINDISIVVPAGKTAYFAVSATRSTENNLTGLAVVRGDTFNTDATFCITENTAATDYFMLSTVGVRRNAGATDETLNIFVRFAGNASGTSVTYFMYVL